MKFLHKILPTILIFSLAACTTTSDQTNNRSETSVLPDLQKSLTIYNLKDVDSPPRAIRHQAPKYPQEMREKKISGSVIVSYVIQIDGIPEQITIKESSDIAFEPTAIETIEKTRYTPAMKSGNPVACRVSQNLQWDI